MVAGGSVHRPEPSKPGRHRFRLWHIRLDRLAWRLPVPAVPHRHQAERRRAARQRRSRAGVQEEPVRAARRAIVLRYQRGLFLPKAGLSDLDKLAADQGADELFGLTSARRGRAHRSDAFPRTRKATATPRQPSAKHPEASRGYARLSLEDAMRRLLTTGGISRRRYGTVRSDIRALSGKEGSARWLGLGDEAKRQKRAGYHPCPPQGGRRGVCDTPCG